MIDDSTLHIVLSSGLAASWAIVAWNFTTIIRLDKENTEFKATAKAVEQLKGLDKEVTEIKIKVGNGLGEKIDELKDDFRDFKRQFQLEMERQERFRRQRLGGKPEEE